MTDIPQEWVGVAEAAVECDFSPAAQERVMVTLSIIAERDMAREQAADLREQLNLIRAERDRYREALEAICRKHDEMVWGEDYEHVAVSNFADETARKALGFDGLPK
jgi:hypothetical protein